MNSGIPFRMPPIHIYDFFKGFKVEKVGQVPQVCAPLGSSHAPYLTAVALYPTPKQDGVYIINAADGKPSGDAYVVFKSEPEAKAACEKMVNGCLV